MTKELDNIIEKIRKAKPELENKYFITEIGIFGSYARNEQTEDSDIDILIDFKRGMTLFTLINFKEFLENLLGKRVDIADKQMLKPKLSSYILSEVVYV